MKLSRLFYHKRQGAFFAVMLLMFSPFFAKAQTIQTGNYNTTGYIRGDGTIQNASCTTTGYAKGVKGMGSGGVFLLSV